MCEVNPYVRCGSLNHAEFTANNYLERIMNCLVRNATPSAVTTVRNAVIL